MRHRYRETSRLDLKPTLRDTREGEMRISTICEDGTQVDPGSIVMNRMTPRKYVAELLTRTGIESLSDVNNAGPVAPRVIYTRSQKRWLREHGLWPVQTQRAPWRRTTSMVSSPCAHFRLISGRPAVQLTFTPQSRTTVLETGDAPHRRWTTFESRLAGSLEFGDLGQALRASEPPEGYIPWMAPKAGYAAALLRAQRRALENTFPKLGFGFSPITFLLELAEIRSMSAQLKSIATFILRNPQSIRRRLWDALWRAVREKAMGKHVSDWFLLYQFGLAPLVDDLVLIFKTLINTQAQIEQLRMRSGLRQLVHCQEVIPLKTYDTNTGSITLDFDTDEAYTAFHAWQPVVTGRNKGHFVFPYIDHVKPEKLKYHLTTQYTMDIPDLYGFENFLLGLDAWGLNFSVSQVWAHVPFSFLLDWIVPVGQWLEENADRKACPIHITIHQCVESVVGEYTRSLWGQAPLGVLECGGDFDGYEHLTGCAVDDSALWNGRVYIRWVNNGLPPTSGPNLRMPKGMKWLSATALLLQRI